MTIPLQSSIIYGPLDSRRFGKSLGINLLPVEGKLCSFDCIYCQYGKTDADASLSFPKAEEIKEAAEVYFQEAVVKNTRIDWIMLSGNGEPTLHPDFHRVILILTELRDSFLPGIPIGILSNSSTCHRTDIRDSLSKLDGRFMKLDAGNTECLKAVNRPLLESYWKEVMGGLYHLPRIVLQSMFVTGVFDNAVDAAVDEWIEVVRYIRPEAVQVYTTERPTAHEGVLPVSIERLEAIANSLTAKTRIAAMVYD